MEDMLIDTRRKEPVEGAGVDRPAPLEAALGAAVRRDRFKLIHYFDTGEVELYDLATDIGESRDLAGSRPKIRDELAGLLSTWLEDTAALMPISR